MAVSVIEQFSNTKSMIGYKTFWRHSLTAAHMTNILADIINKRELNEMRQELFLSGLLHDVVEDSNIEIKEIRKEFGENIAFLVEGITKLGKLKYRGAVY